MWLSLFGIVAGIALGLGFAAVILASDEGKARMIHATHGNGGQKAAKRKR